MYLRYSRQRELIEKAVKAQVVHPTADDIYAILKTANENISLGTIYRNLNLLAQTGVIKKLSMPSGSDRFDGELYEHYHVLCTECGQLFDVPLVTMTELDASIQEQTGVTPVSHQILIMGICTKCNN
ncbi:MAG: transcriptional repressor [Oscillospiraceae bacterium]